MLNLLDEDCIECLGSRAWRARTSDPSSFICFLVLLALSWDYRLRLFCRSRGEWGAWCGFGVGGSAFRGLFCWCVSLALWWGGHLLLLGGSQGGWRGSFHMV